MPSFAPLPNIELDPRTEAELVQSAARRVYEASNNTLNDFSSGSPIMALLEGQAFAQSEFLQFANQFPEAVLVEWIGPFLGAQRKTGAGAVAEITFTITPRDDQFDVFEGYQLSTDPALTNGESIGFVTTERLVIPAGQSTGKVNAVSLFRGTNANVPENSITRSNTSLAGVVAVTNEERAAGGQDPELLSEVKERFFTLIRRRNPVSAEDWQDFFADALGVGTATTVLPRRSEGDTYRYGGPFENQISFGTNPSYGGDYIRTNPSVAFFVLNPDGTPITSAQQSALNNLIRWSLPVEFLGFVYPMEVNDVDFVIDLAYDPAKPYAQDTQTFTETVRNSLFAVMTPNAVFPISYDQQVSDVESALSTTFPLTLGVTNQYLDPDIRSIKAYFPPTGVSISEFRGTTPKPFNRNNSVMTDDLVLVQGNVLNTFYTALEDFTPELNDRPFYVNTGDLDLELIRTLESGFFSVGDVVFNPDGGTLHVVLTSFDFGSSNRTAATLVANGFLSAAKDFSPWEPGLVNALDDSGAFNPPIFEFIQGDVPFVTAVPSSMFPNAHPTSRPGYPVYVANQSFEIAENTTSLGTAQNQGLVSSSETQIFLLTVGEEYAENEYVRTPAANELTRNEIDRENCYIDSSQGVIELYFLVSEGFSFDLDVSDRDYAKAVDTLISQGVLKPVQVIPFRDCNGDSTFVNKPFRYSARFGLGEYVRFRPEGGFDAAELEECQRQNEQCSNVTENCRKLLEARLPLPRYFFALKDFTPDTSDLQSLIDREIIAEVESNIFASTYTASVDSSRAVEPFRITNDLIETEQIVSETDLVIGQTAAVFDEVGNPRGLFSWTGSWTEIAPELPTFRDIFRFSPGDVASFRSTTEIRQYKALDYVTPILDLEVYFDNGVFERTNLTETVKWYDPNYRLEDIIYWEQRGATSFYRVISSFTPPETRTVVTGASTESTARIEEIADNLLKFTVLGECSDSITSRLKDQASTTKLGFVQINLSSKSIGSKNETFVYESTDNVNQNSALSFVPGTDFQYGPVDYGNGTLAL